MEMTESDREDPVGRGALSGCAPYLVGTNKTAAAATPVAAVLAELSRVEFTVTAMIPRPCTSSLQTVLKQDPGDLATTHGTGAS